MILEIMLRIIVFRIIIIISSYSYPVVFVIFTDELTCILEKSKYMHNIYIYKRGVFLFLFVFFLTMAPSMCSRSLTV